MSEKVCLKWYDFHTNVSKSFSKLRNEENFYDVTLVSDDQMQISAHKVVLASCSEYFRSILKSTKHSNPLLCLEGITSSEINNVLDYIYNGEVNIHHDDVGRFLNIAERLKLEGLDSYENDVDEKVPIIDSKDLLTNSLYVKEETDVNKIVVQSEEYQNIEELDAKILNYIEKDVGSRWKCTQCDKSFAKRCHVKEHVEIHFDGLLFPCTVCGASLRSRTTLRHHYKKHELNKAN